MYSVLQPSPADGEMEFLSTGDHDDNNTSGMSPFNMTGGFDDTVSPAPSDLDALSDEAGLTPPFGLAK